MLRRSVPLGTVSGLLLLLLASGCSSSRHEVTETYYLVASNIKLPYWQAAFAGLSRAAGDLKVKAELVGPAKYNPAEQRDMFRTVVGKKPAGIMVSAADPALMKGEINAAIAAGIPVITIDSDAPGSQRLFFIGTNNYQAGITGGQVLAQRMNRKGNVVVFTIPAQVNLAERLRGYEAALADTQIKVLQTVDIRGDPALAFDKTIEIIDSKKLNVDGFVCLEATAGKEVADVLARRKVQGKTIIAMDTDDGTLDWIDKGGIAATVAQKPFTMAYYGLRALDDLHHNKPAKLDVNWSQDLQSLLPSVIDTGSSLIDRSNAGAIRKTAYFPGPQPKALALLHRP
ncbi:MAG TPA: substrate-binding domain-containing protein [Bryobacteraceae bacterium]|nr:substrate-binding domain-containing protein [Bryobacteraceae bacterium]